MDNECRQEIGDGTSAAIERPRERERGLGDSSCDAEETAINQLLPDSGQNKRESFLKNYEETNLRHGEVNSHGAEARLE